MKGRFELPQNVAIILVGVGGTLIFLVFTIINMGTSVEILQRNIDELNVIDAAHIVENCLKDGNVMIQKEFLDDNKNRNLCEVCGICEIEAVAWVRDIVSEKEWGFHRVTAVYGSSALVSIQEEDGEIHMGRLYVKI